MGSPTDIRTSVTALGLLRKIALSRFREFTRSDWDAFQGCESKDPLIADDVQYNGVGHTIVIDGEEINVIRDGDMYGGQLFRLVSREPSASVLTAEDSPHQLSVDETSCMDSDAVAYVVIMSPEDADKTVYLSYRNTSATCSASGGGKIKVTHLLGEALTDDPEQIDKMLADLRAEARELCLPIPDYVRIRKVTLQERDYEWE